MFKVSSSGAVAERLAARASAWQARTKMGACVKIPEALKWLHWQEHGTPAGTIVPVPPNTALAFPGPGGKVITPSVDHPGIRAHHTIAKTQEDVQESLQGLVRGALKSGGIDNPSQVEQALLEAANRAKELVTEGLEQDLPGTRPDNPEYPKQGGKLHGQTAASVFEELAEVVNDSV